MATKKCLGARVGLVIRPGGQNGGWVRLVLLWMLNFKSHISLSQWRFWLGLQPSLSYLQCGEPNINLWSSVMSASHCSNFDSPKACFFTISPVLAAM